MKTELKCPHCGETCETDCDLQIGQHVRCPFCDEKFSFGVETDNAEGANNQAAHASAGVTHKTKPKVVFDFERCERELSSKWHRKVRPKRFRWTKGKIAFWSVVVLFNIVFLIFGLPTCLEACRNEQSAERARQGKLLEEQEYLKLKRWYGDQLRYNGLAEVTMGSGWDSAGGFQLSLTDGSMDTIILDYSTRTDRLIYPRGRIQPGFAMDLVRVRIKIAVYEAKYKH